VNYRCRQCREKSGSGSSLWMYFHAVWYNHPGMMHDRSTGVTKEWRHTP
jgi:hypothetical protein